MFDVFRRSNDSIRLALSFFILAIASTTHAQTNSPLASWLAAQPNIETWSAELTETKVLKSLSSPIVSTGRVWFAKPNKFRWELGNPAVTIAVRAGEEMQVIYPRLKRVEIYPLNQAGPWRDALSLLEAGFPKDQSDLEARFRIVSQATGNGLCNVVLQPKSASARKLMPQITIAFGTNDFTLRATELQFADGSTMRNDFRNIALNPKIDPSLFSPKITGDFQIVQPMKSK
jgi:outer membrane lipoprotein-sorting protein